MRRPTSEADILAAHERVLRIMVRAILRDMGYQTVPPEQQPPRKARLTKPLRLVGPEDETPVITEYPETVTIIEADRR